MLTEVDEVSRTIRNNGLEKAFIHELVSLADESIGEHPPALVNPELLQERLLVCRLLDRGWLHHQRAERELSQLSHVELIVAFGRGWKQSLPNPLIEGHGELRNGTGFLLPYGIMTLQTMG